MYVFEDDVEEVTDFPLLSEDDEETVETTQTEVSSVDFSLVPMD